MKTMIIAAVVCITVISCSKSHREASNKIVGQWEHRKDIGGIAAVIHYPAGNGNIQQFGSNNELTILQPGGTSYTGTYNIRTSARENKWLLTLQYMLNGQMQSTTDTVQFEGNQLIYLPMQLCCDMQTRYYERVNGKP